MRLHISIILREHWFNNAFACFIYILFKQQLFTTTPSFQKMLVFKAKKVGFVQSFCLFRLHLNIKGFKPQSPRHLLVFPRVFRFFHFTHSKHRGRATPPLRAIDICAPQPSGRPGSLSRSVTSADRPTRPIPRKL